MARLSDIVSPRPTEQSLAECYDAIERALDRPGIEARTQALADWDAAKREVETWITLAYIRFHQDTADIQAKADQAHGDAIKPKATAHDIRLKRRLLAERDRAGAGTAGRRPCRSPLATRRHDVRPADRQ